MKEEWAKEMKPNEVLRNHLDYSRICLKRAQTFVTSKQFTSGYDIEGDMLYYTVDDDEDESSDLNLFMGV